MNEDSGSFIRVVRTLGRRTVKGLKSTIRRIPIYGLVFFARPDSRRGAAKEVVVATVFSLLPIWLYPTLLFFADQPFWETVRSCLVRGELYLYSAALLGPLIYSVSKRYGAEGDNVGDTPVAERGFPRVLSLRFPYGDLFSVIAIVVCVIAAGVFALIRASADDFFALALNQEATLWVSVGLYVFTLSCMFCGLVYRLDLENIPVRFDDDTEVLKDQWRDR